MNASSLFAAAATSALCLAMAACSDPSFTVKGTVTEASGKTVILEKADLAGVWMPLDSARLDDSGDFSFRRIAPAYPEIYRLSLDGNFIYFPVDSVETITIDAPAARFASDFNVSGSDQAVAMGNFEKELLAAARLLENPDSARSFKRRVYTSYLQEAKGSVISYYILTKTVGGHPLFELPDDARYFAAVATAFREYRPHDPRLDLLTATATRAQRRSSGAPRKVVEAEEISFIDIDLPDTAGRQVRLSDVAGKGSPTLLVFSDLSDPATPALNAGLRALNGVSVYNVGLDDDQLSWRNAASNLPWTCVYANDSATSRLIGSYAVTSLPTIFVIDASGTLKARCTSLADVKRNL